MIQCFYRFRVVNKLFSKYNSRLSNKLVFNPSNSRTGLHQNNVLFIRNLFTVNGCFKIKSLSLPVLNQKHFISTCSYTYAAVSDPNDADRLEKLERVFQVDDEVFTETSLPLDKWASIIKEKALPLKRFTQEVFDTFIITKLIRVNNVHLACSYIDYLKTKEQTLNFVAESIYLMLLANNINSINWDIFLASYNKLKKNEHLPEGIVKNIVEALCLTKVWEESNIHIERLEKSNPTRDSLNSVYNSMVRALAKNKDMETAFEYVKMKLIANNILKINLLEDKTIEYLLSIIKESADMQYQKENFINLFKIFQETEIVLSEILANILCTFSQNYWNSRRIRIENGNQCKSCRAQLDEIPCNATTINKLKHVFENKTLKGSDIFQNTTPQEVERYLGFLNRHAPFDAVVDGLNITFKIMKMKNNNSLIKKCFYSLSQRFGNGKVLVISRLHSKHLYTTALGSLNALSNVKFYFLDDISKDDFFILYSAFHSGLGCKIVTSDYLRNHKFLAEGADPQLKKQFSNWQNLHQLLVDVTRGRLIIQEPYRFHRVTQWNADTRSWHIPVETNDELRYMDISEEWLCLTEVKGNCQQHSRQPQKKIPMKQ